MMVYDTKGVPSWCRFTALMDEAEFLAVRVVIEETVKDMEAMEKRDEDDQRMLDLFKSIRQRMNRPAKKEKV